MRPWLAALPVCAALAGGGCAWSPCLGDGVINGDVIIEDGEVRTGGLFINGAQGTTESSPIEECTAVAGFVWIQGALADTRVLDSLQWIGGNLVFDGVSGLDELDGLNELGSIGGYLWFITSDVPGEWSPIEELSGLRRLREIGADLKMQTVWEVTGMGAVEHIGGEVRFDGSPDFFSDPWPITELSGLVVRQSRLPSLEVFESVTTVQSTVILDSVNRLRATGLAALESVGAGFQIVQSSRLETVTDMASLTSVGGDLVIELNPRVPCDEAQAWASSIEVGGDVSICAR